jgi:hypothetical protein
MLDFFQSAFAGNISAATLVNDKESGCRLMTGRCAIARMNSQRAMTRILSARQKKLTKINSWPINEDIFLLHLA